MLKSSLTHSFIHSFFSCHKFWNWLRVKKIVQHRIGCNWMRRCDTTNTHRTERNHGKCLRTTPNLMLLAKRSNDWHHLCLANLAWITCENHENWFRNWILLRIHSAKSQVAMRISSDLLKDLTKLLFSKTSSFDHDFSFEIEKGQAIWVFGNTSQ